MNNEMKTPGESGRSFQETGQQITSAFHQYQKRTRRLTSLALAFGFLAITFSFLLVTGYFVLFRPKANRLLAEYRPVVRIEHSVDAAPSQRPQFDLQQVQANMIHVISFSLMLIALALGFLAAGTLTTLAVVVSSRRASMLEISASLSEMSDALKALRGSKSDPRGA
jgi:hypothetical protein